MPEMVQIKAQIPRDLRKRVFIALAEREQKFTHWLLQQFEGLLQQPSTPDIPIARVGEEVER